MTDVFISYAREDRGFVQRLHDALANAGRQSWVDWEGIPASAKWMAEVRAAIDEADCFCFVVSPDSVESPVCRQEAAHAAASNKRILPLLHRAVPDGLVPETVAAHNWIVFEDGQDFDQAFGVLVKALETEPEHLRTHTRLLVKAKEWDGSKDRSLLLRGSDLTGAEAWLGWAQGKEPAPARLHTAYVLASRKAASRRQRATIGAVAIALVLSLVLATVAVIQRSEAQDAQARAEEQRAVAEERAAESRSRELGALSLLQVSEDPELALLLAIEAAETAETETATTGLRSAIAASHVEAAAQEEGGASALALSADGSVLAVSGLVGRGELGQLQVAYLTLRSPEDLGTARLVALDLDRNAGGVADVAVDPQGRLAAVATEIGAVLIVDVAQASVIRTVFVPAVLGSAQLAFSADGSRLLMAGEAGVTWVDVGTWRVADALPVPSPATGWRDVTVDPAGRWAALGGTSGAYLVDLIHGREPVRLTESAVRSLSFDASGSRLAAAAQDAALVWDTEGGDEVRRLEVDGVSVVALSPDGSTLLAGRADGEAALWDVTSGSEIASLIGHEGAILAAAFDPAGTRVTTAGRDGITRTWRVSSGAQPITTDPVLALSGSGSVIATAGLGGLTFLDAQTGEAISSFEADGTGGCAGAPMAVRISADGALAVATHAERCVAAIDVATGVPLWVQDLAAEADAVASPDPEVWVSPNGQSILMALLVRAGVLSVELRLLDAGTGDERWSEITGTNLVYEADFSEDGSLAFLAGRYGPLGAALYDVDAGTVVCPASASDRVTDVTAIPGGGFALATIDGVQILDGSCAEVDVGELTARPAPVQEIAIRPDGEIAATLGNDGEIRFWDAATGNLLGSVPGTGQDIAFDADGELLVGGQDGAGRVTCECGGFDELLSLARERVTRELTPEERTTYLGETP